MTAGRRTSLHLSYNLCTYTAIPSVYRHILYTKRMCKRIRCLLISKELTNFLAILLLEHLPEEIALINVLLEKLFLQFYHVHLCWGISSCEGTYSSINMLLVYVFLLF